MESEEINKEINVTYETLFEILKRERDSTEVQKVDPNFFEQFISYINEKKSVMLKEDALFSDEERKKTETQIENAKRIVKEIYERREKKLMSMALLRSRTKSNIIDTSTFLEHEKKLFDESVKVLDEFRIKVIENVLRGDVPTNVVLENKTKPEEPVKEEVKEEPKEEKSTKLVRFLNAVPKFVGPELEEYGPFEEEDMANLPAEIVNLLIEKGKVEEINES
ncbi:hypothetical protein ISS07_06660 [Candidatus Woesearchaeota archaeon]|nr:hypothetical protein [Candidatus Woesearchaeota archaeon]